jgi:hypothetical protein
MMKKIIILFLLFASGCMKVEPGAIVIEMNADIQLEEVRGITLANQQGKERVQNAEAN